MHTYAASKSELWSLDVLAANEYFVSNQLSLILCDFYTSRRFHTDALHMVGRRMP